MAGAINIWQPFPKMSVSFDDLADDAVAEIVASCATLDEIRSFQVSCKRAHAQTRVDVFWQRACQKRFVSRTKSSFSALQTDIIAWPSYAQEFSTLFKSPRNVDPEEPSLVPAQAAAEIAFCPGTTWKHCYHFRESFEFLCNELASDMNIGSVLSNTHIEAFFDSLFSSNKINSLDMNTKIILVEFITSLAHRAATLSDSAMSSFEDFVSILLKAVPRMPHKDSLPSIFKRYVVKFPHMWYPLLIRCRGAAAERLGSFLELVSLDNAAATAKIVGLALLDIIPEIESWVATSSMQPSSPTITGSFGLLHVIVVSHGYDTLMKLRKEITKVCSPLPRIEPLISNIRKLLFDVARSSSGPRADAFSVLLVFYGASIALLTPDFSSPEASELLLSAATDVASLLTGGFDFLSDGGKTYLLSEQVISGVECMTKPLCFEESLLILVASRIMKPAQDLEMNVVMPLTKAVLPRESPVTADQLEAISHGVDRAIEIFLAASDNDLASVALLTTKLLVLPEKRISTLSNYQAKADQIAGKVANVAARFNSLKGPLGQQTCLIYSYMVSILFIHFPEEMTAAIAQANAVDEIVLWATARNSSESYTLTGSLIKDCSHLMKPSTVESFLRSHCLRSLRALKPIMFHGQNDSDSSHSSMAAYTTAAAFEKFPEILTPAYWDELVACIACFRCESREFGANIVGVWSCLILYDAEKAMKHLKQNNSGIVFCNTLPRMHLEPEIDFALRALKLLVQVDRDATVAFINAGLFPHSSQAEIDYITNSGYNLTLSAKNFNESPRLLPLVSNRQRMNFRQLLTDRIPDIVDVIKWEQEYIQSLIRNDLQVDNAFTGL